MKQAVRFIAKALWRWDVVAAASTSLYGFGVGAMYGDDHIVAIVLYFVSIVWFAAKAVSWEETRSHPQRLRIVGLTILVAALVFAGSLLWVKHRNEHPKSVLTMQARMGGAYGPSADYTQIDLDINNPSEDAALNLDLVIGRSSKLEITRIWEIPLGRDDCKFEPVNLFPEVREIFKSADDKDRIAISSRETSDEYVARFGSPQWKLGCSRLGGHTSTRFQVGAKKYVEKDSIRVLGSYERIPSKGSRVVRVDNTIPVMK